MDDKLNKTDKEGIDILKYVFNDSLCLFNRIAPNGWINSEFVHFLHPTPEQQFVEHKRMTDKINQLSRKETEKENYKNISEFEQDDIKDIVEYEEFLYVLGLSVYDIFSNNHEVIAFDNKIYDFGSFRGSGHFIADFFNDNISSLSQKHDYRDFYLGTIWISSRADLLPFYEFIFQKLKELNCNWKYFFPRLFSVNPKKIIDTQDNQKSMDYQPEEALLKELELKEDDKKAIEFQEELDKISREKYEDAKYKPLNKIVKAYKNIYGILPDGHPQKEFE